MALRKFIIERDFQRWATRASSVGRISTPRTFEVVIFIPPAAAVTVADQVSLRCSNRHRFNGNDLG
jgi:hypothetical protein